MGEVYRARDTRLNRDVAIKVLHGDAVDPERLQRFMREAQALAALNHPHIAQIYGIEGNALVMEFVEGDELSARLERGAIPVDDAIAIAKQIAEALESAHDVGIVHRDLKPANIKVRDDGTVKVLDFGLAKALGQAGGAGRAGGNYADSPTLATPAEITGAGMILGTAAYMSPEQARGKPVDKRADIWAFGVVLYEMLSGERAFPGDTVTDVIAAVVTREPDWSALPSTTPVRVRELLTRCFEKDHRVRLRDIGEARIALNAPHATPVTARPDLRASASAGKLAPLSTARRVLPWALAALALIAAIAAWQLRPAPPEPLRKTELSLPADGTAFTLSHDGESIAYFARGRVWVRDLASLEARDLAAAPLGQRSGIIWSPDSRSVAYNTADGRVWVVSASGGAPFVVCTIPETRQLMGAEWRRDGSIVLAVWRGSLYQVPATGGEPRAIVTITPGKEVDFHNLVTLPDGRLVVATHLEQPSGTAGGYAIEVIDGTAREVILAQSPFQPFGYVEEGYLLAARFDANAGVWALPYRGRGPLRAEDAFLVAGGGTFATADRHGTLLYSLPPAGPQLRELVWVDRSGRVTGQIGTANDLGNPSLAPDGSRVAFTARVDNMRDVWVRDVQSGADTRVSFEADDEGRPSWFASSRRVIYNVPGRSDVQIVARDVGGASERKDVVPGIGAQVSRDGRYLAFYVDDRGPNRLRYATIGTDGVVSSARPLFTSSPEPEGIGPTFSPDGRLLAFVERQSSGNMEVFVTRFPSGEGRLQISAGGGRAPIWAANGELFYLAGSTDGPKQMMVVRVEDRDTLRANVPVKLFDISEELDANYALPNYDVARDGKQLLMVRRAARTGSATRWVLVQNWPAEFERAR
jgi:Tol biopolymer transport system component